MEETETQSEGKVWRTDTQQSQNPIQADGPRNKHRLKQATPPTLSQFTVHSSVKPHQTSPCAIPKTYLAMALKTSTECNSYKGNIWPITITSDCKINRSRKALTHSLKFFRYTSSCSLSSNAHLFFFAVFATVFSQLSSPWKTAWFPGTSEGVRVMHMEKEYLNTLNKWFYFCGWSKAQSNQRATSLAPLSQAHAPTHPTLADILRGEDGLVIGHGVGDSSINHVLMVNPCHWNTCTHAVA